MRIFFTGGSGKAGRHVAPHLAEQGHDVTNADLVPLEHPAVGDLRVDLTDAGETYFEAVMQDAWVWDMYRPARFVKNVRVLTFKDVNVEELAKSDLQVPDGEQGGGGPGLHG